MNHTVLKGPIPNQNLRPRPSCKGLFTWFFPIDWNYTKRNQCIWNLFDALKLFFYWRWLLHRIILVPKLVHQSPSYFNIALVPRSIKTTMRAWNFSAKGPTPDHLYPRPNNKREDQTIGAHAFISKCNGHAWGQSDLDIIKFTYPWSRHKRPLNSA